MSRYSRYYRMRYFQHFQWFSKYFSFLVRYILIIIFYETKSKKKSRKILSLPNFWFIVCTHLKLSSSFFFSTLKSLYCRLWNSQSPSHELQRPNQLLPTQLQHLQLEQNELEPKIRRLHAQQVQWIQQSW